MAREKEKKLPNQDKIETLLQQHTEAERERKDYKEDWDQSYKEFNGKMDETALAKLKKAGRSHLYIPYNYTLAEWIIARIMTALESATPLVKLIPTGKTRKRSALLNEILIDFQLRRVRTMRTLDDVVRQIVICGNGCIESSWNPTVSSYKGQEINYVDVYNIYIDSKARRFEDAEYLFKRSEVSFDSLWKNRKKLKYQYLKELKKDCTESLKHSPYIPDKEKKGAPGELMVELLHYWGKLKNEHLVLANRKFIINPETSWKNPYSHKEIPFCWFEGTPRHSSPYSRGDVYIMSDMEHELNSSRNLRRDQEKLTVKRRQIVSRTAGISEKALKRFETSGYIMADDINGLRQDAFLPLPREAYSTEAEMKSMMQDAVGAQDYARGVTPKRAETATTILSLQRAANARFEYRLRKIGQELVQLVKMMISNNREFMKRDVWFKIFDEVPREILEEEQEAKFFGASDLKGEFDYMPMLHAFAIEKNERQQKALMLFQLLLKDPYTNPKKRLDFLLDAYEIVDRDEWYSPTPNMTGGAGGGGVPPRSDRGMAEGEPENEEPGMAGIGTEIATDMRGRR